jgi:dolichol-phosphate mannosyltransferase
MSPQPPQLDIVIPVFNEGTNIVSVLDALRRDVATPFRVFICYDHDDDNTLAALRGYVADRFELRFVKNRGQGALGAVVSGFAESTAPAVLVLPADDDYNSGRIDQLMVEFHKGCDIVAASRFMRGGRMVGCPLVKSILVRLVAAFLYYCVRLPTRDATNGFRLFSRRAVTTVPIETQSGFAYSLELLVKCHRLGWKVGEVPVHWYERKKGRSRFRVFRWAPQYLVWVRYALATQLLGKRRR